MGYRRQYYRRSHYRRTAGQQAARRHIGEAQAFSNEVGGTDADVKAYFFSLTPAQLEEIFTAYRAKYTASAASYARQALPKWKAGTTKMSGLVVKRLFDFLPARMPAQVRLQLAENIWRYYGPTARIDYTVGPGADPATVITAVYAKVERAIQDYRIPDAIGTRFAWVSGGDVKAKEALLNHFRQQERELALSLLNAQLPILQAQMRDHAQTTESLKTSVAIHRIDVNLWVDPRLADTYREGRPERKAASTSTGSVWTVIAIVVAVVLLLMMLGRH